MLSYPGAQAVYDTLFASAHPTAENTFKLLLAKRTLASVLAGSEGTGMKFDKPAGENPIDQLKVVGRPHDRIDGPLKTTGTARYAYEWHEEAPNAAYGYIVGSAIAKGRLTALDTDAAQKRRAYWLSLPPVTPGHSAKATKTPPGC